MTNGRIAWLLLAALLGVAGCRGAEAESEAAREPSDRLAAVLGQSADSGTVLPLIEGDTVRVSAPTLAFYRRLRYRPAWAGGKDLSRARAVYDAIGRAGEDGLDPNSYGHDVATRLIAALEGEGESALDGEARGGYEADLDVVLSEGYLRYATDIVRGAIDPDSVGAAWRIPRNEPPDERVLRSLLRGDAVQIIERLRPPTPYYSRMMSALARLKRVRDAGGWVALPSDIQVTEGDSSGGVALLRSRLAASDDPREAQLAQRGSARPLVYDRDLRDALRHFQERHALDDDGALGSGTLRELNHTVEERLAEVRLNMDRWRWLPRDLGRLYVLVNIAGFELEVVENDHAIESMNVVVGKPGWSTPVFADTMEHIVINPYWNPPESIMEEEIRPAMARDPGYLERNNFERTSDGRVRQRPGRGNALGRYKFLFPNKDNIYLHDTPADHLFSRVRRDFSHGCIRLERPADLARLLAGKASSHSPASIDGMVATGQEKWITLKRPIPVYIVYFTAWVKEDGTLRFHHDVYGHDERLESQQEELDEASARQVTAAS